MNVFAHSLQIRYSDADRYGRLKLRSIYDYAQEVAGQHASQLKFGLPQLQSQGRSWVLSRIRLRLLSYPKIGEVVRLETYPRGFDRLFAIREFRFFTERGALFCAGTSCWLLLELANLKILNAANEIAAGMPDNSRFPQTFATVEKISKAGCSLTMSYNIRESQIDLNGHLNNAEHAGIVQDFLGPGVYPTEIQINYQLSIPPGSVLAVGGDRRDMK